MYTISRPEHVFSYILLHMLACYSCVSLDIYTDPVWISHYTPSCIIYIYTLLLYIYIQAHSGYYRRIHVVHFFTDQAYTIPAVCVCVCVCPDTSKGEAWWVHTFVVVCFMCVCVSICACAWVYVCTSIAYMSRI